MIHTGEIDGENSYIIMPRKGENLLSVFKRCREHWSNFTVLNVSLHLMNFFESVHMAGYTFNDLKLDNILMDFGSEPNLANENIFKGIEFHLIDYGFA